MALSFLGVTYFAHMNNFKLTLKVLHEVQHLSLNKYVVRVEWKEDGGEIGGSRVHFPLAPVKRLADLRNRANSPRYSSIYEDRRPKIEDTERSDGKKSA